MTEKLTGEARTAALISLSDAGWVHDQNRDCIHKSFKFRNFNEAFGFMTQTALIAEKMNHHPEWSNVYSRVEVTLITHDVDGLSELDVEMAAKIGKIVGAA